MKKSIAILTLVAAPAFGQDDKAPPAPPAGGYTPAVGAAGGREAPQLTEERIAVLVDQAITRALARQAATMPVASAQSSPAMASPQNAYQPQPVPFTSYLATAPVVAPAQQINVLQPPGPLHQAMARFGNHLAAKGQPRIRTMTIAPQQAIPTYTLTPSPTAVAPAPTQYTPPLPANYIAPTPPAPVKASAQR